MYIFLAAVTIILLGGVSALVAGRDPHLSTKLGAGGIVLGSAAGFTSAAYCLYAGGYETLRHPWAVPFGSLSLGMDALSAFFLLPVFALSGLSAIYGTGYMRSWFGKKPIGPHWFFFGVLTAGMAVVITARDGLLFLVAWEVMSLAPFFLVTFDDDRESVRQAGWTYLVAAYLGAVPLIALFILLGQGSGSLAFEGFGMAASTDAVGAGTLFILALVGFGTKAGFIPLHVWLPEAHPAAPSHVSAVMSGVMIKTGIYGIIRTLTFLGPPSAWWGIALIIIGLVSGVMGVLYAISQHELKRLLAYHSVENIGIIALGLGMGVMGQYLHSQLMTVLGFGGAILHVMNHAVFKGLLFLGAGAVLHSTGTAELDRLGGLMKKMPRTGFAFLVGAAAISGLPPLNGFVSEFMVYLAGIHGGLSADNGVAIASWSLLAGLALIGGLAAACFAKAFGAVFLGEPRDESVSGAHEPAPAMVVPMLALAAGCLMVGLFSPWVLLAAGPAISGASGLPGDVVKSLLVVPASSLMKISAVFALLLGLAAILAWARLRLLAGRDVGAAGTWDCGYARPDARMQYTASSFAQPLTWLMGGLLQAGRRLVMPSGLFPRSASFETEVPGGAMEHIYRPAFNLTAAALDRFRWLQHGKIHLYVLYIIVTLVAMLLWKL